MADWLTIFGLLNTCHTLAAETPAIGLSVFIGVLLAIGIIGVIIHEQGKTQRLRQAAAFAGEYVSNTLAPGESIAGIWQFLKDPQQPVPTSSLVLTDQRACIVQLQEDGDRFVVSGSDNIPLGDISRFAWEVAERMSRDRQTQKHFLLKLVLKNATERRLESVWNKEGADELVTTLDAILKSYEARESRAGVADELEKLSMLVRNGILTEHDWQRAKDMFLGKPLDKQREAILALLDLYKLFQTGALSESEFNSKKWDILARHDIG